MTAVVLITCVITMCLCQPPQLNQGRRILNRVHCFSGEISSEADDVSSHLCLPGWENVIGICFRGPITHIEAEAMKNVLYPAQRTITIGGNGLWMWKGK